jgi:hypothetical protein
MEVLKMKPPRYTIEETFDDGSVLNKHNRKPEFTAIVKKDAEGQYIATTGNQAIPANQLKQMAQWYFFTHVKK